MHFSVLGAVVVVVVALVPASCQLSNTALPGKILGACVRARGVDRDWIRSLTGTSCQDEAQLMIK